MAIDNFSKYKDDLKRLIKFGGDLLNSIQFECYPKEFKAQLRKKIETLHKDEKSQQLAIEEFIKRLPSFYQKYQNWYSESISIVKTILPDRIDDFVRHYIKPKGRKAISYENYVIEDYLQGLSITRGYSKEKVVGPDAAIPQFVQQLNILRSAEQRFESSLFEIKQILQANLFDSELDAARELAKNGFSRAAGVIVGVILEKHLLEICNAHKLKINKNKPTINDYNQLLKDSNVIDMPTWRFIQHLADIRNLCSHNVQDEIKTEQINDLIEGVGKIIKTVY